MSKSFLTLLLVYNENSVRIPIAQQLREEPFKYTVIVAKNSEDALTILSEKKGRIDVALVDEVLEDSTSGLILLKEIRARYSQIKCILFTGNGIQTGLDALFAGAYRYFSKPFNLEELGLAIRAAAEESQKHLEREYLSALVTISQGLTQTTQMDKQLELAWNFVSGHLEVSSFFIALYVPVDKRIYFPLAYDNDKRVDLPDLIIGEDNSRWGLAGFVIANNQEVQWSSLEEKEQICNDLRIFPLQEGDPAASCFCIPLTITGQVRGVLSAQSYQQVAFTPALQNALRALAGHLSVALENSRLFAEVEQTAQNNAIQSKRIAALEDLAISINSKKELSEILTQTCQVAAEFFSADHSGLVVFEPDYSRGVVEAEYPDLGVQGQVIPLQGITKEEEMIRSLEPIVLEDVQNETDLGSVQEIILRAGIQSSLFVPVVGKNGLLGSFSLDSIQQRRRFNRDEIELCKIFASQVAVAIENARLFSQYSNMTEKLNALISNSFDAVIAIDEGQKISVYNRRATELFGWKAEEILTHSAARLYMDKNQALEIFEEVNREGRITNRNVELRHQNGTAIPALLSATVIRDNKNNLVGQAGFIRDLREAKSREQLLTALDGASRFIRAEKQSQKLLHEIVRLSVEMIGWSVGSLFINFQNIQEVEATAIYGFPKEVLGKRLSYDSEIGKVAKTGKFEVFSVGSTNNYKDTLFSEYDIKIAIGLPLKLAGNVEAILFIGDDNPLRILGDSDREILERFAAHASTALHTSYLLDKDQRRYGQLAILHRISDYIQEAGNLDKILHVVLTGVTAGYGLGFNRAALLLLDETGLILKGSMGIGYLNDKDVREAWQKHLSLGLEDFENYRQALERNALPITPVGELVRNMKIPIRENSPDAFSRVIMEMKCKPLSQEELDQLPPEFAYAFKPVEPFIAVPMLARGRSIGLLVADNKFTRAPITNEDIETLMTFANSAAVAIENVQLFKKAEIAHEKIRASLESSNTLVLSRPTAQLLVDIIRQTELAAEASWVSVVLIDGMGYARNLYTTGSDDQVNIREIIRPEGVTMKVMQTGNYEKIEDILQTDSKVNPRMLLNKVGAALCLPFAVQGKRIGVVWIHYDNPRRFSKDEIEAIQLFVNQAAVAYDNTRRMRELVYLRDAADALAGALELPRVLKQIVESACEVLEADSSTLWSYSESGHRLIPGELVAHNIPQVLLEKMRTKEPHQGGTADTVMEREWIGVVDISDPEYAFIGPSTIELLNNIQARSFQGIALKIGNEKLGVLYVNYRDPQEFDEEDRKTLETFAYHASIALKKARLIKQVRKSQDITKLIAELTLLGDKQATLDSIAKGTQEVTGCDAVALFEYDPATNMLLHPPVLVNVHYPDRASKSGKVIPGSLVHEMLQRDTAYVVDKISDDTLFQDKRFSAEEGIQSCIAIPLHVEHQKVGVMFVNYRSLHRFTLEDRQNIELFAAQAAVAIRNAQLHANTKKREIALQGLYEAGKAITNTITLEKTLRRIAEQALNIIQARNQPEGSFSHVALIEGYKLRFVAGFPSEIENDLFDPASGINLDTDSQKGIAGAAALTGITQNIGNVSGHQGFIPLRKDSQTISQLSVPIKIGEKIIGVLSVEHHIIDAFSDEDAKNVESLAAQAGVAIENARLYREAKQRADNLNAVIRVSRTVISSLDLNNILTAACQSAVELLGVDHSGLVLFDKDQIEGRVSAEFPPNGALGATIQLRGVPAEEQLIETRQPIVIPDVANEIALEPVRALLDSLGTRSMLIVPVISKDKILGSFGLDNMKSNRFFSPEEIDLCTVFAAQVAVAIENAQQYEELKQSKGLIGARTALAWMGMINSTWRHAIEKHAITIRDEVDLCREDLALSARIGVITAHLDKIQRLAGLIREKPITPPLESEEGVRSVEVNELIQERIRRLWEDESFQSVTYKLDFSLDYNRTVRVSPEWLNRALDILIENAVEATVGQEKRIIIVSTQLDNGLVQIRVTDNGKGIPPERIPEILQTPVVKTHDEKGLGIGLLFAQLIAQTYGGNINVGSYGPGDTTLIITLPLENNRREDA